MHTHTCQVFIHGIQLAVVERQRLIIKANNTHRGVFMLLFDNKLIILLLEYAVKHQQCLVQYFA